MFLGMMIIALSKDKVEHTDNNRCRLSSVFMVLTFGFIDVFFMPLVDIFTGSNPKNLHPDRMLVVGAVMYVILYHWSKRRLNRVAPVN